MIRRLLVANRGEIARRIFRTCREMGIETVAVYSRADADAAFVADADMAVPIGDPEPSASYLAIDKVVTAATATGADALHPGYGFLAENAEFARACTAAGLTFIGPSADAIETMGSKLESKRLMTGAGVPTLPSVEVTADLDAAAAAGDIGYPVLVKASAGGGGKGMRIVRRPEDLTASIEGAVREATAAFGDGTVFLEKYLDDPRHVEIQVLGDTHGRIVHLFERECSIQRRHQKVIEEAPSPAMNPELRAQMGEAAVAAARAVDYVGAGTVEFLLDRHGGFWFLEMNTRLQVEHPVTEAITGLDLVRLQLEVADGAPLPDEVIDATIHGHAIEARLYAEDPTNDYLPVTGIIERFAIEGVRVDTGVEDGSEISIHYDPLIAKVVAHAPTREDAIRALARALRTASLHGPANNRALLVGVLEHEEFAAGQTDTGFLERHDPGELSTSTDGTDLVDAHAIAAALAGQAVRRAAAPVLASLPSGWRNSPSQLSPARLSDGDRTVEIGYRIHREHVELAIDGTPVEPATLHATSATRVDFEWRGVRRRYTVGRHGIRLFVDSPLGSTTFTELPLLPVPEPEVEPGSLLAPMPGKVVRVLAEVGQRVTAGQTLLIVEAMKMEHSIDSPVAGLVSALAVDEGTQVDAEQVLAIVEEDAG